MKIKYRRFKTARIVEHWVQIATFGILVVTGLSQRFHAIDLSLWFILHFGGIDNVRLVHRYVGLLFSLTTLLHIAGAGIGIVYGRWQPVHGHHEERFPKRRP